MKRFATMMAGLALLLVSTSPAAAEPVLPVGDTLFEVECYHLSNAHQLHSLDIDEGTRTPIGNGVGENTVTSCAYQGAILPGTDWYYFLDGISQELSRVHLVTGQVELVGLLEEDGTIPPIVSIAIDFAGDAFALSGSALYSVDLETGELAEENPADIFALTGGYPFGFAFDTKTNKFYVAENSNGNLYTLDVSTGEYTLVATNAEYRVGSMSFDSKGRLWVNGDDYGVASVTLANFGDTSRWYDSGDLSPEVYSESLVVRHASSDAEGLANTGSADVTPYLLGGLLAAGIALALRRRRV